MSVLKIGKTEQDILASATYDFMRRLLENPQTREKIEKRIKEKAELESPANSQCGDVRILSI